MKSHTPRKLHQRKLGRQTLIGFASIAAVSSLSAQSTWVGDTSNDWNDATNWSSDPASPTGNFIVNTSTGNFPVLTDTSAFTPVDIFVGTGAGNSGRLDHSAGTLAAGAINWSFVGDGAGASGVYNLTGSASFTTGRLIVGQAGSTGTVTMNTTGSLTASVAGGDWWNGSGLSVGVDGNSNATFNLEAGTVNTTGSNANVWVGSFGSTGTINLTGGTLNVGGTLSLARYLGNGTVNVTNAVVNAASVNISHAGNDGDFSTGVMSLNSGATVNSEGDVTAGFAGNSASQGTLNVNAGSVLNIATSTKRALVVNQWDTAKGLVNVNGGTVNLNANTDVRFSNGNGSGASVLTLSSGAITSYSGNGSGDATSGKVDLNTGGGVTANNTFNLDGGVLTISQIITSSDNGTATFNFTGGTLRAANSSISFLDLGGASQTAVVEAGGAIIDTNGYDVTIPQALLDGTGGGGLTKNGVGVLTLTGANTFTGDIAINGGSLSVNSAFIDDSADVNMVTGSIFDLNFSGTDTIASLFINGAPQAIGTYGSVGSSATFQLSAFTGTGLLSVTASAIPEPSTFAALAGIAALALGGTRRRRS